MKNYVFFLFAVMIIISSCANSNKVDTIVHHAVIYTVDSAFSVAEAMAIKDGKIVAVGKNEEISKQYTATENIDAKGQALYPGLIDAHAHFVGYARGLFQVNLFDTKSFEETVERIKAFAKEHPDMQWIQGKANNSLPMNY
ncbi:MAG: amidohydrolase [Chitinophagaceae bacterium]|nr:MAG: amidohydrolase [Chitinophagaceae bacterium]